jgi:hypothetical protein
MNVKQQIPQAPQPMAKSGPIINYLYANPASGALGDKVNIPK